MDIECPYCHDSGGHFAINTLKMVYNCWKCGFSGKIVGSINRIKSILSGIKPKNSKRSAHTNFVTERVKEYKELSRMGPHVAKNPYNYCLNRGMTPEQITKYRVLVRPLDNRVYFPYWDVNDPNNVVWMCGRFIGEENDMIPKVVEIGSNEKPLFGYHVNNNKFPFSVIVEGVFDHMVTPYSFAIMGNRITDHQADVLSTTKPNMVIIFGDPDASEGMRVTRKKLFNRGIRTTLVHTIGDGDPNSWGRPVMTKLIELIRRNLSYKNQHDLSVEIREGHKLTIYRR